jgi:hypothetical protein
MKLRFQADSQELAMVKAVASLEPGPIAGNTRPLGKILSTLTNC